VNTRHYGVPGSLATRESCAAHVPHSRAPARRVPINRYVEPISQACALMTSCCHATIAALVFLSPNGYGAYFVVGRMLVELGQPILPPVTHQVAAEQAAQWLRGQLAPQSE